MMIRPKRGLAATALVLGFAPLTPAQPCVLPERQKLTASDATVRDYFGGTVSISGVRLIVAASGDDVACPDDPDCDSGSVYVFRLENHGTPSNPGDYLWVQEAKLIPSDAVAGDHFGGSISISGDWVAGGATGPGASGDFAGAVYVFRRDDRGTPSDPSDDLWLQEDKLTASDASQADGLGGSVAISGDWIVAGARWDDDACPDDPYGCASGSAYVFRRGEDGRWTEQAKLTASDADLYDQFGNAVAISGTQIIVVGAFLDDDAGSESGSAYVFRLDDDGTPDPGDDHWVEADKLTALDAAPGDHFGRAVSISGDRIIIGAYADDDAGDFTGSAYVFRRDDNGTPSEAGDDFWVEEAKITASDAAAEAAFGGAVGLSDDRAVVGAWGDDEAGDLSGSAYVFRRDDNGTPSDPSDDSWIEQAKLTASDGAAGDIFGGSVSISGERVVAGGPGDDDAGDRSGAAYVFSVARSCADLADYADFQVCFHGAGGGVPAGCEGHNLDGDDDVDLVDFAEFVTFLVGP
jgi:hypothetical protein